MKNNMIFMIEEKSPGIGVHLHVDEKCSTFNAPSVSLSKDEHLFPGFYNVLQIPYTIYEQEKGVHLSSMIHLEH